MKSKYLWWLLGIFLLALAFRFFNFRESVYFGFDEARDIYAATDIYTKGDLKLIGPPATGNIGLFHGPFYWYIIGPIYLLFKGNPEMVSAIFRIINALGVFLIFALAKNMFNPLSGLIAAFLYAVSFEESQYAMYVGNPSLGVLTNLLIFWGASLIYKKDGNKKLGLWTMFTAAAIATQLNLMFAYSFATVLILLILLRKKITNISKKFWSLVIMTILLILSTYFITEMKYGFRSIKIAFSLLAKGFGIMSPEQSKYLLYLNKYLMMFRDNLFGFSDNKIILGILAIIISGWALYRAAKNVRYQILLLWMFAWITLMALGGHTAYYTNAGIALGIIIFVGVELAGILKKYTVLVILFLALILLGNGILVINQSGKSLISDIKPQPMMKLADEKRVIDVMYKEAEGKGFTVRLTGIPYRVQTVWAYLFHYYGMNKYGYLPYWETGTTLGFPGELPTPINGTTCVRFLVREPMRGLPESLVEADINEENIFSIRTDRKEIGLFIVESRKAHDKDCHNKKAY